MSELLSVVADVARQLHIAMGDSENWMPHDWEIYYAAERADEQIKQLQLQAAPGRRTDSEYRDMGKPDGWTWLPEVQMWARQDQDHVDALRRERELVRLLKRHWKGRYFGGVTHKDTAEINEALAKINKPKPLSQWLLEGQLAKLDAQENSDG